MTPPSPPPPPPPPPPQCAMYNYKTLYDYYYNYYYQMGEIDMNNPSKGAAPTPSVVDVPNNPDANEPSNTGKPRDNVDTSVTLLLKNLKKNDTTTNDSNNNNIVVNNDDQDKKAAHAKPTPDARMGNCKNAKAYKNLRGNGRNNDFANNNVGSDNNYDVERPPTPVTSSQPAAGAATSPAATQAPGVSDTSEMIPIGALLKTLRTTCNNNNTNSDAILNSNYDMDGDSDNFDIPYDLIVTRRFSQEELRARSHNYLMSIITDYGTTISCPHYEGPPSEPVIVRPKLPAEELLPGCAKLTRDQRQLDVGKMAECVKFNIDNCINKIRSTEGPTTNANDDTSIITKDSIGPYDVLFGRHKLAYNNPGNKRFRALLSKYSPVYLKCAGKKEKRELFHFILAHLRELGARFVKASMVDGDNERDAASYGFEILKKDKAISKIGHSLRDSAVKNKKSTMKAWEAMLKNEKKMKKNTTFHD